MEEISFDSVDKALQKFRPYLLRDGGDYELIDVTQDGIVKIRLLGACVTCPSSDMTLKMGIELTLSEKNFLALKKSFKFF
ncbi:NifU family protein [Listeria fleischmannii FSL S10-1203]|uniref:NifU family protein n=1 Tax=Listeria fleischmannii FSL S10-1203 TaxID=1265822 RepID=W7DHY2_9LIST|nr:NifU family protein [Listeria fleischmannii FSL S10-1203]